MVTIGATPRLTSLAPQFLVDNLARSMAYYRDVLGFSFGEPWGGFYDSAGGTAVEPNAGGAKDR